MRTLPLAAVVVLLAACGGGDGATTPGGETEARDGTTTAPGDTGTAPDESATTTCTNDAEGFSVAYPTDWHTNEGGVAPPCSFFHPEPFELPEASEAVGVAAIRVDREPVAFERVAGESVGREVLEREETTVAGRPAVRLEYESTGEGLLDEGTRGVDYLVDLGGGETLIASTVGVGGLDFEENVRVLDEMVQTIALTR